MSVSISTAQKGVCSTQVAFVSFTPWDYCRCCFEGGFLHLPSVPGSFQTGSQERGPWLPFLSLITPRHVSSSSPVCLINSAIFKCLHATLSSFSCSFLHSELLYFYLFLSFCDLNVHSCFPPVVEKLVTEWVSAVFSSKKQVQTYLILVEKKLCFDFYKSCLDI